MNKLHIDFRYRMEQESKNQIWKDKNMYIITTYVYTMHNAEVIHLLFGNSSLFIQWLDSGDVLL